MTDKEWKMLRMAHEFRDVLCHSDEGETCLSNNHGRCVCLYNTNFPNNVCPFYCDKRGMTEQEQKEYKRLFYYRGADRIIG